MQKRAAKSKKYDDDKNSEIKSCAGTKVFVVGMFRAPGFQAESNFVGTLGLPIFIKTTVEKVNSIILK